MHVLDISWSVSNITGEFPLSAGNTTMLVSSLSAVNRVTLCDKEVLLLFVQGEVGRFYSIPPFAALGV